MTMETVRVLNTMMVDICEEADWEEDKVGIEMDVHSATRNLMCDYNCIGGDVDFATMGEFTRRFEAGIKRLRELYKNEKVKEYVKGITEA